MIKTYKVPEKYIKKFHDAYGKVKFHDFRVNYDSRNFEKQKDYVNCFDNLANAFGNVLELRYMTLNRETNTIEEDIDIRGETRYFFHQMLTVVCYLRTPNREPTFISECIVALENYLSQIHVFMETLYLSSFSLHAHFTKDPYGNDEWIWRIYELNEKEKTFKLAFRSIDAEIKVCEYEIKRWGSCFDLDKKLGEEIKRLKKRKSLGR